MKARRDELRRVAYSKIDELERTAIATAKQRIVAYEGQVLAGHLESAEATLRPAALPDLDHLIPAIDPAEVQKTLSIPGPSDY
jgi:hypothetical protein